MKRFVNLEEISDGKLYNADSMVRIDTCGCINCHACCSQMGETIALDPLDIFNISKAIEMTQNEVILKYAVLNIEEKIVLPYLRFNKESDSCYFLNKEGRCSIHTARPGICRLFPLGRYYHADNKFSYFLQVNECTYSTKIKTKVSKWLEIDDLKKYEEYISSWHEFIMFFRRKLSQINDNEIVKQLNTYVLKILFMNQYTSSDFYIEFYDRLGKIKSLISEGI